MHHPGRFVSREREGVPSFSRVSSRTSEQSERDPGSITTGRCIREDLEPRPRATTTFHGYRARLALRFRLRSASYGGRVAGTTVEMLFETLIADEALRRSVAGRCPLGADCKAFRKESLNLAG